MVFRAEAAVVLEGEPLALVFKAVAGLVDAFVELVVNSVVVDVELQRCSMETPCESEGNASNQREGSST